MLLIKLPRTQWLFRFTGLIFSWFLFSSQAYADKFDDAVNHYLKGFESCKEASGLLRSNQIVDAKAQMREYQNYFDQAQKMDPAITKTKNRGMEGNILFCQRVAQNLEVEEGAPYMDNAIEHCDLAQKALKAADPVSAQVSLDKFREASAQAFDIAPRMKDIFSIASQVRRCERLQKKVSKFSQKLETDNLAIETVKEESASYLTACLETEKQLNSRSVDDALIKSASQGISSAISHQTNTKEESRAFRIFKDQPGHEAKAVVEGNLKKGDQCIKTVKKLLARKKASLKKIKSKFSLYQSQLKTAQKKCDTAFKQASVKASDSAYKLARKQFQKAQVDDAVIRKSLKRDKAYASYSSWPQVKAIDGKLVKVGACISKTNKKIGAMFASLQADKRAKEQAAEKEREAAAAKVKAEAKARAQAQANARREAEQLAKLAAEKAALAAKAAAEVKAKAAREAAEAQAKAAAKAAAVAKAAVKKAAEDQRLAEEKAKAEAAAQAKREALAAKRAAGTVNGSGIDAVNHVKGVITFDGLIADHGVIYIDDGSNSPSLLEIELDKSGFDADVYVAGSNTNISIKNKDNSLHRIKATDDVSGYSDNLARIYPRQKKRAKVSWPLNSIVSIRSERGALTASYIAHINSGTFKHVPFNVGRSTFEFEFNGKGKGTTAYLIMPGYDLIIFDFAKGSEQTKPIMQDGAPVGSVAVRAK